MPSWSAANFSAKCCCSVLTCAQSTSTSSLQRAKFQVELTADLYWVYAAIYYWVLCNSTRWHVRDYIRQLWTYSCKGINASDNSKRAPKRLSPVPIQLNFIFWVILQEIWTSYYMNLKKYSNVLTILHTFLQYATSLVHKYHSTPGSWTCSPTSCKSL